MKGFLFSSCIGEKSRQWLQVAAVLSASLLAVISGNHIGWASPSVKKLLDNDMGFSISENEVSIIVMIAPLGFLIGGPISGILLDKIGRKKTMLLIAIPHIISWLLIATTTSPVGLYVGRVFSGISDGAIFTCLPIYFAEILEPRVRGTLGVCHSIGILTGIFLINIYGSFVSIRLAAYISLTIPLLFLFTFNWMPESPYYLLAKGQKADAEIALKQFRLMRNVQTELDQIDADVKRQLSEPCSIKDIFMISTNLKAFFIILMLRSFQQFAGVTACNNYLQVIFQRANTGLSPEYSAIIVVAAQIIFVIATGHLLDKFGRRPLLIFSYTSVSIVFIVLGIFFYLDRNGFDLNNFSWLPVTGMVLYNILVSVGAMPIPNLMSGELLSASVKSKALGIINIYSGIAMSATSKLFQWLDYDFGMHAPFFAFASICALGVLYSYFYAPETKGKSLEEIQQYLKNGAKLSDLSTRESANVERVDSLCMFLSCFLVIYYGLQKWQHIALIMLLHYGLQKFVSYRDQNQQWPQIIAATCCTLAMFNAGTLVTWTSPSIPILISNDSHIEPLTMNEASYLAILPFSTMALLSLLTAMFMDFAGRKKTLFLMSLLHCASWILILVAKNLSILYLSRLIFGIAESACFCAIPTYLAEMAEPKVRSYFGPLFTLNLFLGQLMINLIGSYNNIQSTATIFLCFPLIHAFLILNIPESPYFLCMKNKHIEAKAALQRLRWTKNVNEEFLEIESTIKWQSLESTKFKDLFLVKANRNAFFICVGLRLIAQFSGLTAFMVYTQYLFALSGSDWSASTSSIVYFGIFLVITTGFGFVSGTFCRKPLMTISCLGCSLALGTVSVFLFIHEQTSFDTSSFNWLPLLGMLMFIIFGSVGITIIPNIMIGELFSASVKSKAMGMLGIVHTILAVIVIKLFQVLTMNYGMYLPFGIFAVSCAFGAIFSCCFLPETKGKLLSDILKELG